MRSRPCPIGQRWPSPPVSDRLRHRNRACWTEGQAFAHGSGLPSRRQPHHPHPADHPRSSPSGRCCPLSVTLPRYAAAFAIAPNAFKSMPAPAVPADAPPHPCLLRLRHLSVCHAPPHPCLRSASPSMRSPGGTMLSPACAPLHRRTEHPLSVCHATAMRAAFAIAPNAFKSRQCHSIVSRLRFILQRTISAHFPTPFRGVRNPR